MSLLPMLIKIHHPHDFGRTIYPDELEFTTSPDTFVFPLGSNQYHRPRYQRKMKSCSGNKSTVGKDGFQVCMDVEDFAPNEISVKTVDNTIVVEGKHEERQDEHGHIARQFTRRYTIPEGYNVNDVVSQLSSDGVLTVKAPPEQKAVEGNVRVIQIQHTGPAHLTVGNKENAGKPAESNVENVTEKLNKL